VVVPVELASVKLETAARTIRPKITKHLDRFLVDLPTARLRNSVRPRVGHGEDLSDVDKLLSTLELDRDVPPVPLFTGGTTAGKEVLQAFLRDSFPTYSEHRNQPQTNDVSHMSKYLHFGQLSPVWIALQVKNKGGGQNADDFCEELIIRRELPMNYVFYNPDYDNYSGLPEWARRTLSDHAGDKRPYVYSLEQLKRADTHDPYWNAAMREMIFTGYLHNHMRMYWGKKILEWSTSPSEAHARTLHLNNTYFLDGRDANSFANVAWIFGSHDRGWTEREVFGKVRYMNAQGLERKADPKAYVEKVDALVEEVRNAR
jgi:deoxyribodipyrimidine photo-lyase